MSLSYLVDKQPESVFEDGFHIDRAYIHVFDHRSCRSLRTPPYPFSDSFYYLRCSNSVFTPSTVFRYSKLLKSVHSMVHRGFSNVQELFQYSMSLSFPGNEAELSCHVYSFLEKFDENYFL